MICRQIKYLGNSFRWLPLCFYFPLFAFVIAFGLSLSRSIALICAFIQCVAYIFYVFSFMPMSKFCCRSLLV